MSNLVLASITSWRKRYCRMMMGRGGLGLGVETRAASEITEKDREKRTFVYRRRHATNRR